MKKTLLVLLLTLVSLYVKSDTQTTINGVQYVIADDNTVTVVASDDGYRGSITIPEKIKYNNVEYKVTEISNYAFYNCTALTSLTIPYSVKKIGICAFKNCVAMTTFSFSYSSNSVLEQIGEEAFDGCSSLKSIDIPHAVKSINKRTFEGCGSLSTVKFGKGITSVEERAFYGCTSLTSISNLTSTSTPSIVSIGDYAFYGCVKLNSLQGVFTSSLISIGSHAFENCNTLPTSSWSLSNVTSIGEYAFSGCSSLTNITSLTGLISLGEKAFYGCSSLSKVTLGNKTSAIGKQTFSGCTNLSTLTLQGVSTVAAVGEEAFYGCKNLTAFSAGNSLKAIGQKAFMGCTALSSVSATSLETIGDRAFMNCSNLKTLSIGSSLTSLGEEAFNGCKGLTSASLGTVKVIGNSTFDGCTSLSSVTANSVESVGDYAFRYCSSMTKVNLSADMAYVGTGAFYGCGKLAYFYTSGSSSTNKIETIGDEAFYNCSSLQSLNLYKVKSLGRSAFYKCAALKSVSLDKVTAIDEYTFYGCSGLTDLSFGISNNLTSIGNHAFEGCSGSLGSISIPNSTTFIGDYAFYGCSGITSISLSYNLTSISDYAFAGCSKISSVNLSSSDVTTIGEKAFYNCSSLTSVSFPSELISLGNEAFRGCSSVTSITWGGNLKTISDGAFYGCSSLNKIDLPSKITSVGAEAFYGCGQVTTISLPSTLTNIGSSAFYGSNSLNYVYVYFKTPLPITSTTFSNVANATLRVPTGSKGAFAAANYWRDFGVIKEPEPVDPPISFVDAKVKELCISNWDSNKNGELSKKEAAAVTDLGEVFKGNTDITSFDELQYFTGLLCNDEDISGQTYSGIPYFAFMGCSNLKQVTLPSVEVIGHAAFSGSGLTAVTIPNSVSNIMDEAFYHTNISEFILPANVTDICDAYDVAGLISSPNLKSIVVESGNPVYDSRENCNAIIRTANNLLVNGCGNTTIPASVTSIRSYAFMDCSDLTAISIPSSVASIGDYSFEGCDNLTSVTVDNSIPIAISNVTFSNYSNATLYVPAGSKAAYEAATGWKEFGAIIEMNTDSESGDLNGDGKVNGTDLVVQTNLIMTGQYNATADLNNDGKVNGTDFVLMVNKILEITSAPAISASGSNRAASTASLSIEDFDIKAGETKEMFIGLNNPDTEVTLVQFDLRLPYGLSIVTENSEQTFDIVGRTTWKRHSLLANTTNGITRFLLSSNTNAPIDGDDGDVISIKLAAANDFNGGNIKLENQLLVSPNAEEVLSAEYIYSLGETTSINAFVSGQPADVYTLIGSKVRTEATTLEGLPKGVYIIKDKKIIVR